ncbi:hypothetical protein KKC94_02455 [Patescibacteria group bacterium]|nr:hypothetical protein [Patescibacteria group bacterium]
MSFKDFEKKLQKTFLEIDDREVILKEFEAFSEKHSPGMAVRVFLSVLKCSEGDLGEAKELIKAANVDYRDVISMGEYPEQYKNGPSPERKKKDLKQFKKWLRSIL